jgi:hypothetical protein
VVNFELVVTRKSPFLNNFFPKTLKMFQNIQIFHKVIKICLLPGKTLFKTTVMVLRLCIICCR